ncbi:MAG TPA: ribosome assembly cofactor RimP [Bacteroidales bacterium]|nr:ribosome assembly cofactor RimP [Bacteroidales bacterium]
METNIIRQLIADYLKDGDCYLVSLSISDDNRIEVIIDSDGSVSLEQCAELNNYLNEHLDRDAEDYELEVSSAGLTSPLVLPRQFRKNIGNPVVALTTDGRKIHATLTAADDNNIELAYQVKQQLPGSKRKTLVEQKENFTYQQLKQVTYDLKF